MQDKLFEDLSLVSRAARFPNLSAAATHIGISQPQLSRIVSRLEKATGVQVLDRTSRRHSRWTADALRLVEAYGSMVQDFRQELGQIKQGKIPERVNLATLEGLGSTASSLAVKVFKAKVPMVALDVLDMTPLEDAFVAREYDAIITVRVPDRSPDCGMKVLGYQTSTMIKETKSYGVMSTFELTTSAMPGPFERTLVSNSLSIRKAWLERHGGTGRLPEAKVTEKQVKESFQVYLLWHEHLPGVLRETFRAFRV